MDHFSQLRRQLLFRIWLLMLGAGIATIAVVWLLIDLLSLPGIAAALAGFAILLLMSLVFARTAADLALAPLQALWQAIVHVAPEHQGTAAPNFDRLRLGRELVTNLALQVYQFASQENSQDLMVHRQQVIQAANIVSHLPVPMFVFNKQLLVVNASDTALAYCKVESADLFGKPIFDSLNLEFPSELTLEVWLKDCQDNKVTDTAYWERVRVIAKDESVVHQCDIAAYYNRDNPSGTDFIVTLFDRTAQYDQDDDALGFVAMAVHELRTPLTMLRGYIEAFEEELGGQLNDELKDFMLKMEASANQLSSFVHNILNVAKIEGDQLALHLTEEKWDDVLRAGAANMELQAKILGKTIEYHIDPKLPTVGVDRVSSYEIINNLLDNALKYSPQAEKIIVSSQLSKDGLVETTVQDFGVGIPASVVPNLFERFYRSHRTRSNVGGTGLGLFLSKALVNAQGGQIWATSKEGEGSTFGFSVVPYSKLAADAKTGNNTDITRQAHGWIKNHSMYRR